MPRRIPIERYFRFGESSSFSLCQRMLLHFLLLLLQFAARRWFHPCVSKGLFLGGVDSSFLPPIRRNSTAPFFPLLSLPMRRHHLKKARTSLKNACQANGSFSFKRKCLLKITTVFSRWLLKFAQAGEKQNPFSTVPRGSPPLLELWFG